jgi:hypothetical protein
MAFGENGNQGETEDVVFAADDRAERLFQLGRAG